VSAAQFVRFDASRFPTLIVRANLHVCYQPTRIPNQYATNIPTTIRIRKAPINPMTVKYHANAEWNRNTGQSSSQYVTADVERETDSGAKVRELRNSCFRDCVLEHMLKQVHHQAGVIAVHPVADVSGCDIETLRRSERQTGELTRIELDCPQTPTRR
jgi:hypothetical protein